MTGTIPDQPDTLLDPANPFDGSETFTGESEQVAGLGNILGKIGKAIVHTGEKGADNVAEKAAQATADNIAIKAGEAVLTPPATVPVQAVKKAPVPKPKPPHPSAKLEPATPEKAKAAMEHTAPAAVDTARNDWRNFTLKRLSTSDDVKDMIDFVAQQEGGFQAARRGVVSNEQTTREAAAHSLEQLMGRQPAQAWNAAQIKAGHELMLETGKRIVELKDAWKAGLATSDEDLLTFRRLLAQHAAIQEQMSGAAAEAGRALQIFNSVTGSAGKLRAQQVRDALEAMGGRGGVEKMMDAIDKMGSTPEVIAQAARKTAWRRTADAVSEWTVNAMLSGPATHQANIAGNAIAMLMHIPERATAGLIGKVMPGPEHVQMGEAAQMMFGITQGMKDGFRLAWKAIKDGDATSAAGKMEWHDPAITAAKFNLPEDGLMGKAVDLFGEYYVRLPGRALQGEDEFFKALSMRMELNARAYRQAAQEGLSGTDFGKRVQQLINDPPDAMIADAQSFSRYSTFTNSLWEGKGLLSKAGQAGQSVFSDHPIAKLTIAPFIRTPVNIAKYIVERSPLEAISPDFWHAMKVGGAQRDLALARMSLGSLVGAAMMSEYYTQAEDGNVTRRITGNGPDDPRARAALMATGWQPNSILMGDTYVSYNRADPFGAIIGMYANALDILEYSAGDETSDEVGAAVVLGTADALMSKTYMSSLAEFFDLLTTKPGATLTSFAAEQAGKPIPAWLSTVARATDTDADGNPILRDTRTGSAAEQFLKTIKARTPGLASGLPPKRDIWGQPIVKGGKLSVLTPFATSSAKDDQITARLIELDAVPPKLSKVVTWHGKALDLVEMDGGEGWLWDRYQEAAGVYSRKMLDKAGVAELNQKYDLASLPPEAISKAQDKIRDVYRNAKQAALVVTIAQSQGVIQKSDKLPTMEEVVDLASRLDMQGAGALFQAKPIGSRRLPPHMKGGGAGVIPGGN